MKKFLLMLTALLLVASCGRKIAYEKDSAQFFEQFTVEKLLRLLDGDMTAQQCGLSFVYEDGEEGSEGDAGWSVVVYGRGVERGDRKEFGYELKCNSEHACFLRLQEDTSQQASLCFKNRDDANRFFDKIVHSGILKMGDTYIIPKEKLPQGKPVQVESLRDYNPRYDISKPAYDDGYYAIRIDWYY